MAENSSIEWCDHTFNPWIGCTKVSPGCANCYAETLMDIRYGRVRWGKGNARERTSAANWKLPVRWNQEADGLSVCSECHWRGIVSKTKNARYTGNVWHCPYCDARGTLRVNHRPRVFCASLADWLDDEVPIEWLADLLDLIRQTPNLDWLLLTKRPENFQRVQDAGYRLEQDANWAKLPKDHPAVNLHAWIGDWTVLRRPPSNVWIGTTVEDQTRADERIPQLLQIPAQVRFLSCEPLLGPVRFPNLIRKATACGRTTDRSEPISLLGGLHWVIAGGESGHGARPMHPEWVRSLRDQCWAAGVPFLFKQWGEWQPLSTVDGRQILPFGDYMPRSNPPFGFLKSGKKRAGRILDGREHNEFPEVAR